jgi:integrase
MSADLIELIPSQDAIIPVDHNPAAVYLAGLSAGSLPAQRSALRKIANLAGYTLESMPWAELRYQHVQAIRAQLQGIYNPATSNRMLTALRRVLFHGWKLGLIPEGDYRIMADLERIKGAKDDVEDELTGRALSMGELSAIMAVCAADNTLAGVRDAAIIALGYGLGLRRSEISKMQLQDYNREKATVTVKSGKGGKSRTLPINNGAMDALEDWLTVRGGDPGLMFWGVNRWGAISTRRVNVRGVNELYIKRATSAKVKDTGFHDLRRSFISDLLDQGVDLALVSKLAGHSDPRTTLRYDRRAMDRRREAVKTLHVPYTRRGV